MTTEDCYRMAQEMEFDGCAHGLTLAMILGALSPIFGADLVREVNAGRMSFDEVILALYFAVFAPADVHVKAPATVCVTRVNGGTIALEVIE